MGEGYGGRVGERGMGRELRGVGGGAVGELRGVGERGTGEE